MNMVTNNGVTVRNATQSDVLFVQYMFGYREVLTRCMIKDEWASDTKGFVEFCDRDDKTWMWIVENQEHQPVGLMLNYIAPALNSTLALWSTYAIHPRERRKRYASNALACVPSLFGDMHLSVSYEALLIAQDNIASQGVARNVGFEKIFNGGGKKSDGSVTLDALWVRKL